MKFNKDPRHESRRLAINYIYSHSISSITPEVDYLITTLSITNYDINLFEKIKEAYLQNIDNLNNLINPLLSTWNQDQLLDIDIIIIKIAVIELLLLKVTPVKVAVDEAIELAKEFGSEKSSKFVNGVLAKVIENNKL